MSGIVRCPRCGAKNRLRPESEGVPRCARCKRLLPWVTAAAEQSFVSETAASVPVVVDFWAPWCAPCKAVEPILERLANEHAGRLKVVKVNVDEEPSLASRWGAMSIPLLVALRNGEEVDRIVGAPAPAELERRIRAVLAPSRPAAGSPGMTRNEGNQ
jgi:thioredoxin 2